MVDPCAAPRPPAEDVLETPAASDAVPGTNEAGPRWRADDPPVADWRGFHDALRHAALAATQSGGPLSLLLLDISDKLDAGPSTGPARASDAGAATVDALAGIGTELGATGALACYAEQRLAVIAATDLSGAIVRAMRIGHSLTSSAAGEPGLPAIGVAEYRDDEPLGQLIERATEALDRARSDGGAIAVARPRARRRHGARELCPCGLRTHACLCGQV